MTPRPAPTIKEAPEARWPANASVVLITGDGHLSRHALDAGQPLLIGRDPSCDLVLDHPMVSRRHVRVIGGHPLLVEDAGSTNGVRVAGRRVDPGQRVAVDAGTPVQFGPFSAIVADAVSSSGSSTGGGAMLEVADPGAAELSGVVARIAASDVSVLVRGETGVGKDVLARAIHAQSRRTGPMMAINCAALSESLLESELFGHERGAVTGAVQAKAGLFEAAANGTVFLDEIGEMPLPLQAKLLRAVESRQVVRVGGLRPIDLDVRFIAATHRDLPGDVARGVFRQDLYFRLNGITLVVPPLRARRPSIVPLAHQLLAEACRRTGRSPVPRLSESAIARLRSHDWPGNVRELKVVIERALLLAPDDEISGRHLAIDPAPVSPTPVAMLAVRPVVSPREEESDERTRLVAALEQCAGNQTEAAKLLGISRATIVQKLRLHRIPRPRRR